LQHVRRDAARREGLAAIADPCFKLSRINVLFAAIEKNKYWDFFCMIYRVSILMKEPNYKKSRDKNTGQRKNSTYCPCTERQKCVTDALARNFTE